MINDLTLSGVSKDQRYTGDLMIPQSLSFLVRSLYLLIYIVESLWLLCTNKVYLALHSEISINERQKNTKRDKFTQIMREIYVTVQITRFCSPFDIQGGGGGLGFAKIMHEIYVTVQITRFCSPGIMTKELSKLVNMDGNRCPLPHEHFKAALPEKKFK